MQNARKTNRTDLVFWVSFFLEGTTAILKIVGIVLGVLSAVCVLIGGCCKYHKSRDDNEPTLQGSENADAGVENLDLKEQTTKM